MAQPPAYNRTKDFGADYGDQTDNEAINSELDAVSSSINGIRKNLGMLQRDDGGLRDGIVTKDALAPELKDELYAEFSGNINDSVLEAQQAAGEANNAALVAVNASTTAVGARDAAQIAQSSAQASAAAASGSQSAAAGSATSAQASAGSATSSAASAAASAGVAQAARDEAEAARDAAVLAKDIAIPASQIATEKATEATEAAATATEGATLAQAWATKSDGPVSGNEFSAKHYAELAAQGMGLPVFFPDNIPSEDVGPIYISGQGVAEWDTAKGGYRVISEVPVGKADWCSLRTAVWAGWIPSDGQEVSRATFPDLAQEVLEGRVPVVTDAEWLADPLKRGAYTLGDGSTTIRVPDYNGMSPGSVGAVVLRGDGAMSAGMDGVIQRDAFQGHKFLIKTLAGSGEGNYAGIPTGSDYGPYNPKTKIGSGSTNDNTATNMVASELIADGISGSPRAAAETRATNVTGCFVIKAFGAVLNPGSVDAAQLASDLAAVVASVSTLQGQMSQVYGVAQTLQDVSGSRTPGTTYVNATARPIHIYVSATVTAAGGGLRILVDSKSASYSQQSSVGSVSAVSTSIPAGASYQILTASVNAASIVCLEYR